MKNKLSIILIALIGVVIFSSCKIKDVEPGTVAVKVTKFGSEKGVNAVELTPGRYTIGINTSLYPFPTFTQNYVWTSDSTEGSPTNESFNFQDVQGLELNADLGITYHIQPDKADVIFQKYRKGLDEITHVYLRNMVRDALVNASSTMDVADIYGIGKTALMTTVKKAVVTQCEPLGIIIENIYWIGRIKVPESVKKAINSKIEATQIAQQRENELRATEAEAAKKVAVAQGDADALTIAAAAEAKANRLKSSAITQSLIEYEKAIRWDGKLPQVTGGSIPMINLK